MTDEQVYITTVGLLDGYTVIPNTHFAYDRKYDVVYASVVDGRLEPLSKEDIKILDQEWCEWTYNKSIIGEKCMQKREASIKRLEAELKFEKEYCEHFKNILSQENNQEQSNTTSTIAFDESVQICTKEEFAAEVKQFRSNLVAGLTHLELGKDKEVEVDFNRWHINTLTVVSQLTKMGYTTIAGQRGGDIYYLIIEKSV